uniref:Uncharacterized protein n=1 Tax=Monodelphis domestica TaxID=13616 RepID=A0A5F8GAF3_MONDO
RMSRSSLASRPDETGHTSKRTFIRDSLKRGVLGRCHYVYYGKNSEGNRFIRDDQL